jgi:hypothetical protein
MEKHLSMQISFLFHNTKMEGNSLKKLNPDHLLEDGLPLDSLQLQNGQEEMELDLQETLESSKYPAKQVEPSRKLLEQNLHQFTIQEEI